MKKSLREQFIKQSLNSYMWSRYLVEETTGECPLVVNHHNGLDMEDLTTGCFDLNLSLLKELRNALQSASPAHFEAIFGVRGTLPRVIQKRTKLFVKLKSASDKDLSAIAPLYGGCLFRPRELDDVKRFLEKVDDAPLTVTRPGRFFGFIATFWMAAWMHANKAPVLTGMVFGLDQDLVETLRYTSSRKICRLIQSDQPFQFEIKMSEPLLLLSNAENRNPTLRLFQIANLLQHRSHEELLGFTD